MDHNHPTPDAEAQLPTSTSDPPQPNTISLSGLSLQSATQFPLQIDFSSKLAWYLSLGYIKHRSIKNKQQFQHCFTSTQNIRYIRCMFWYLLFLKLPMIAFKKHPNRHLLLPQLQLSLRSQLSKAYVQLFLSVPTPKERISNHLTFSDVSFLLKLYNETFKQEEMELVVTPRFVVDSFHIAIFQALGLEVSERYISQNIDEIFTEFWKNIPAEYQKKNKQREDKAKKEKRMKEDKQVDFFQGKIVKHQPTNFEEEQFLKELEEMMYVEKRVPKRRRDGSMKGLGGLRPRKDSRTGGFGATKTSFTNELMNAQKIVLKKKMDEQNKKYEQQQKKYEFMAKLQQMQATKSSSLLTLKPLNTRQTISVSRLGPCVTQFLHLKTNRLPQQSNPKLIHHPQQKVLTNDYLRRLMLENITYELPPEEIVEKSKSIDITKPLKDVSLMEIPSYRRLEERALRRLLEPPNYGDRVRENPESSKTRLPEITNRERFRRPEVLVDAEEEEKVDDIFLHTKYKVEEEVPEEYRQVKYRNNIGKYKKNYKQ